MNCVSFCISSAKRYSLLDTMSEAASTLWTFLRLFIPALCITVFCIVCRYIQKVAETPVTSSRRVSDSPLRFQQLLGDVTARVSSTMAKNLSVPIVFVCLLHLANEKVIMKRVTLLAVTEVG
jgi:Condensin complex subunit 2